MKWRERKQCRFWACCRCSLIILWPDRVKNTHFMWPLVLLSVFFIVVGLFSFLIIGHLKSVCYNRNVVYWVSYAIDFVEMIKSCFVIEQSDHNSNWFSVWWVWPFAGLCYNFRLHWFDARDTPLRCFGFQCAP